MTSALILGGWGFDLDYKRRTGVQLCHQLTFWTSHAHTRMLFLVYGSPLFFILAAFVHYIHLMLDMLRYLRIRRRRRRRRRQLRDAATFDKPKRIWARRWLLRRSELGMHERLLKELNREDKKTFKNYVRVPHDLFEEMVERLSPMLQKKHTKMREPLPVALKLAVTLQFLASGCK